MRSQDIYTRLQRVQVQHNPTPPSSPPHKSHDRGSLRHRKRKMPSRNASTPQKRPRPMDDLETRSLSTQLTDRTRFDPSVQSSSGPSRQRNPARDLNDLPLSTPPIHCTRPKDIPLPDSSVSLRRTLCANFRLKVIPVGLKVLFPFSSSRPHHLTRPLVVLQDKIYAADPEGAMDIPDTAFDGADSRRLAKGDRAPLSSLQGYLSAIIFPNLQQAE
ncbi:hypothetical protein BDV59DRAFT_66972 [Aspergillus ambiguus]|uniref:uncharacterized protein n=1 Tax=Aspergillus ambiguus TaxID=176160 RepID=UPI003CCDFA3D